jgi:hypothetical protein
MYQALEIHRLSALLIAYQRPNNFEKILRKVVEAGIKDIYISLDYPRNPNVESLQLREDTVGIIQRFALDPTLRIRLSSFSQNVGCGVAVTTACDWFFRSVDTGLVLEDDCIPTPGFFSFMQYALKELESAEDVFIVSGCRLHPTLDGDAEWELNSFPIFWGWGSTADKWSFISSQIKNPLPPYERYPKRFSIRSVYWRAGSRRVKEGFVDTWDTLVSELFHRLDLRNLSPNKSLIENVGDDQYATHDMSYIARLPRASDVFQRPSSVPLFSALNNEVCGKYLYKYRLRHFFTTAMTKLLDDTIRNRQKSTPFVERFNASAEFYSEQKLPFK